VDEMSKSKLDPKRTRFVQEYLIDLNATQAAIRAEYSKKTANKVGPRLLVNVGVQRAIAAAMKAREARTEITQDRVLQELAIVGFSDLANYIDINEDTGSIRAKGFDEMPKNSSRALESITENRTVREDAKGEDSIINEKVTFRMHSKIEALKLLGNHLGMFTDLNFKGKLDLNMALSISDLKKSMAAYKKQ
jgi:phage terminase small subunit